MTTKPEPIRGIHRVYAPPPGEPLSEEYVVRAGGVDVPAYRCRVSAVPLNQVWPGYQRPLDQTEIAAFASCEAAGPIELEVTCNRDVQAVIVRPLSRGIAARITGRKIAFCLPGPGQYTVEADGWHRALHLFIDPPETGAPAPDAPHVRYFGPGVHRPGKIVMESGDTVYIAGGAVVYGCVHARGATGIRILGRGILDVSEFERGAGGGAIRLEDCSDITIDGLILRDPDVWCCSLFGCRRATLSHLKLIGLWRYNADGIDLCNSQEIVVRDCFVRAFDDNLVLKGLNFATRDKNAASYHERPVRDIVVERCVVWNDWGRALEIGAETSAPEFANIVFRDCDIIRTDNIAMDIQHGDRAAIHDVRFENIRVEIDAFNLRPRFQQAPGETYPVKADDDYCPLLMYIGIRANYYSADTQRGTVRNVVFQDIFVNAKLFPASWFGGAAPDSDVAGVTVRNLRVNGAPCKTPEEAHLTIAEHVSEVRFL